MKESAFIVMEIPMKVGAVVCRQRTVSIMSREKVIDVRLKRRIAMYVDEEHYGFRKGKGARNAIVV